MKRYEKYKPSGIEWIGEVPEHWGLVKTKFVCSLNTGNSLNAQQKAFYGEITEDEPSRPYIASKDIDRDTEFIDYDNGIRIPLDESSFEVAPANSTLLCIEGGSAGKKMGFVDREVCYVNKLCCFNSFKINPKYQYYFVKSRPYWEVFSQNIQGMIGGVSVGVLKEIKMPFPAPAEQEAIAAYLDGRCGDIDKVVVTQEKRIALLNEMKQSIITQAVTRGLNPDAKMKDSGVEWIGMVPEHWDVKRIKHIGTICSGDGISSQEISDEGTYEVYGGNGLMGYSERFNVVDDKIVIGRVGALCGNIHVSKGKRFVTDNALVFTITDNSDLDYVAYYMICADFNKLNTSSAQPLITGTKVLNVKIAIPSMEEQCLIAEFLDRRCGEIDKQIEAVTRQIELLREYKQALITEVVTGKRKVC